MASPPNPRAARWLRSELPKLIESGAISAEDARAIERHYETHPPVSQNFGFALLATVGSALVAAGIILLVAHNWDEFSRPLRSIIAFLPLICAQALAAFVLLRRDNSKPWRESAAIFNVAAIGAAISLVSQTYQIHGSLPDFLVVWMLLSLPLVYLLRTTLGACAYLVGAASWLLEHETRGVFGPLLFWLLLLPLLPYCAMVYRRARDGREMTALAVVLSIVTAIGLGFAASFTKANLGMLGFAGFFTAVYLCGIELFRADERDRLHPIAHLGGIAIGVMSIVLTFEDFWRDSDARVWPEGWPQIIGGAIELAFPLAAIVLAIWSFLRGRINFSFLAAAFPVVAIAAWLISHPTETRGAFFAAMLFNLYTLGLGVELIARGLRADSIARANFGLLVIAGLAIARFFDSDLSFVLRAIGFIVIGIGFLLTNVLLFRKRSAA